MARAVTMESLGEAAGAGSGPLSCHNTCRGWLGVPTAPVSAASSCTGPAHLRHSHHRPHPLQDVYLQYQPGPIVASAPMPSPPPCSRRDEAKAGSISGQPSDSDSAEQPEAVGEQGPLPDLLPHNEHPPRAPNQDEASRERTVRESDARRLGDQLRTMGDEYNAMVLRRAVRHPVPNWEDWRDACRGLLTFITQTLSTLYRLT